ncbi:MAG: acyl-CoA carboxylase subunit beta [Dehalococcoidia bacterium]
MVGFTWEKARRELKERRQRAHKLGGPEMVKRQRKGGRRTVRERLVELVDRDTFLEIGTLAVNKRYDGEGNELAPTASSYVMGLAEIDGRPVAVGGEDFTVQGGSIGVGLDRKKGGMGGFVEDLAHEYRIPLVMCMEGVGGGVGREAAEGHAPLVSSASFARSLGLLGEVPVLIAVMGACAGVTAARVAASHFSVMTRDTACLFAGGPPIVERALGHRIDKFELGGAQVHTRDSGLVDNVAQDEADALSQLKRVLSYLPQNVWEAPSHVETDDPPDRRDEFFLGIMPEDRRRAYDVHDLIEVLVDWGSFFEIGPDWGRALVTGLCRFGGYPVGILANNPMHVGGALDPPASQKQARFIEFCDTFHLPLAYLVDVPGFMIGGAAERGGTLRKGMRALQAMLEATVPMVTVHVRKAFGMACCATANPEGLMLRLAWPTAEFGDMPIEGGVAAGFRREIETAVDPDARRAEIEARMLKLASPFGTAEAFGVEEMIDPTETREFIFDFIKGSQGFIRTNLGPKYRCGVRV